MSSAHSQSGHPDQKDATHPVVNEGNIYAIWILKWHHLECMGLWFLELLLSFPDNRGSYIIEIMESSMWINDIPLERNWPIVSNFTISSKCIILFTVISKGSELLLSDKIENLVLQFIFNLCWACLYKAQKIWIA